MSNRINYDAHLYAIQLVALWKLIRMNELKLSICYARLSIVIMIIIANKLNYEI